MGTTFYLFTCIGIATAYYIYALYKIVKSKSWTLHYAQQTASRQRLHVDQHQTRSTSLLTRQAPHQWTSKLWYTSPKEIKRKLSYLWGTVSSKSLSRQHLSIIALTLLYIPITRAHKVLPEFSIDYYSHSSHFIFYLAKAITFLLIIYISWLFINIPFSKNFRSIVLTVWAGYAIGELLLTLPLYKDYYFETAYLLGIYLGPALLIFATKARLLLTTNYKQKATQHQQAKKDIENLTKNELKEISQLAYKLNTLPELITDGEDIELLRTEILNRTQEMGKLLTKVELQINMYKLKTS